MTAAERLAALECGIEALDRRLTEAGQSAARDTERIEVLESRITALHRGLALATAAARLPEPDAGSGRPGARPGAEQHDRPRLLTLVRDPDQEAGREAEAG